MKLNQRSSYQPHPKNFDETFAEVAQRVRPSAYMTPAVAPQAIKQMLQMPLEKITDFWIVDIDNQSVGTIGATVVNENEGYLGLYCKMYNQKLIETTAKLVAEICERWELKPDATTIIGHESFSKSRHDPGAKLNTETKSYFHWDDFLSRVKSYYRGGLI